MEKEQDMYRDGGDEKEEENDMNRDIPPVLGLAATDAWQPRQRQRQHWALARCEHRDRPYPRAWMRGTGSTPS
jgi:hypothetical protein